MRQTHLVPFALVTILAAMLTSCGSADSLEEDPLVELGRDLDSKEIELLGRIKSAKNTESRAVLIEELQATPVKFHPYYSRCLVLNEVQPFHCWSDDGYDPSKSHVPRDVQLLAATRYGIADIENGGFHQFFGNSTGVFAPEMVEWFERASMPEAARIMKMAIAKFGDSFPRSQEVRNEFLVRFQGAKREEWDPFFQLDTPFYEAISGSRENQDQPRPFDVAANKWLRDDCGIVDLKTTLKSD
jgi:hypothetical protein